MFNLTKSKNLKKKKRICRGNGSGNGKTGGRGNKGQKSRSGYKHKRSFEGGQSSIYRRIPKFGFNNKNKKKYRIIKLLDLYKIKENLIDINVLKKYKIIGTNDNNVKIILNKNNNILKFKYIKNIKLSKSICNIIKNSGGIILND
ncbi:50S ribosomal protein L15 [Candidatus Nardonella dryophthoridicola]|uniref:50S ribosomal protein L15 n=1 Tax=Candidatus Nardonella dryophthoridicola TaxID=1971485 RepID=UPI001AD8851A|nr:50S ribosomal protein L15 [Candidatus Nardonella dryophthoridicola]QTJ62863.1 50S ribosomal protein L15 [Candidatus Nardonella dryophthoridicola]